MNTTICRNLWKLTFGKLALSHSQEGILTTCWLWTTHTQPRQLKKYIHLRWIWKRPHNPNGTSYLDLYLFKTENGLLSRRLYDKRDDFNFDIVNYPFLDSNIPISPAYGVYISRLVAFARSCQLSDDFNQRHKCLIQKLVSQGYSIKRLHSKFLKFCNIYTTLVCKYGLAVQDLWRSVS